MVQLPELHDDRRETDLKAQLRSALIGKRAAAALLTILVQFNGPQGRKSRTILVSYGG